MGTCVAPVSGVTSPGRFEGLARVASAATLALTFLGGCGALGGREASWERRSPPSVTVIRPPTDEAPVTRSVVIVTLDGTRWQEIFLGVDPELARRSGMRKDEVVPADRLLPNFYRRVIARGIAVGAPGYGGPIYASGPSFISLPGYMELLGGAPSGCESNGCAAITRPTLVDDFRSELGLAAPDVAVIASWEKLERAATNEGESIALSAGRHGGATRDLLRVDATSSALLDLAAETAPEIGVDDYRADRFTAPLALRYLEARAPRFLFVGLGDTDEHGHDHDYRGYVASLQFADAFIGRLFAILDAMGERGAATSVFITADHGRSADFTNHGDEASSRVWLLAAGGAVPTRGFVSAGGSHHLADVAPTIRALVGLERGAGSTGTAVAELLPVGGPVGERTARGN